MSASAAPPPDTFASAARRADAAAAGATPDAGLQPCVDLLKVGPAFATRLGPGLQARGLLPRAFDDVEAWLAALRERAPQALIAPAAAVPAVAEVLEKLALSDPRMASVLLVAYGAAEQRLNAMLGGADWYLDALLDPQLGSQLAGWIREQDTAPFRVLLIDDDAEGRLYCSSILKRVGMQVEAFEDAEQAIARVPEFKPDLVLVDLYMPGMDGLTVTSRLRAGESSPLLPIVFLSGEERPAARFNALRLGADDFLTKPIRPRPLIAAVRSRIKRARSFNRTLGVAQADTGPRLRRGDFLTELERRLRAPESGWRVLLALRVDQAAALRERLGLSGTHALERALATRIRSVMDAGDRYSLWEEFGFGVLLERPDVAAVRTVLAALLAAANSQAFEINGESIRLSLSIGTALSPRDARDASTERWIASAFSAVSVASQFGGNRTEGVLSRDPGALPPERVLVIHHALKDLARGGSPRFEFQPLLRLRGDRGSYALAAKLRDLRAPLQGYPRNEYLALAREQEALASLDRMTLFHAFEAIAEQRQHGRASCVLVPLDLASVDVRQLAWFEAELRRRPELSSDLRIELDAAAILDAAHVSQLQRLQATGIGLGASSLSPSLDLLDRLRDQPVQLLRLPYALINQASPEQLALKIAAWQAMGRELLVDGVEAVAAVGALWNLGVDFLQGDALAAASPRLDFESPEGEEAQ